ncbi:MAG: Eco57I restriction-modification methylase domain-containing protein, partial [Rhodothermales bacterium]
MPRTDKALRSAIQDFNFVEAFNEVGWDYLDQLSPGVEVDGYLYVLKPVAEKKGVQVFTVAPDAGGLIPARDVRKKIDRKIADYAKEHLLIYTDRAKTKQVWQWVDRARGKAPAYREHEWHRSQDPEGLIQKLHIISISLDEEDAVTVVDVAARLERAFDKEKVTKKFYRDFDRQRKAFLKEIKGISDEPDREWYASALLNRLMFVYFLQRKGFLDSDPFYLRNRLARCRERFGDDEFYSFYRTFLLKLFHDGLGAPASKREAELRDLIGDVPYLNGGLFQIHQMERDYDAIAIKDEAFEKLFKFFEGWDWTLDYRPLRSGKEINPDVLGYLFEQYINNKQMGAYYTKEDVTGYITRNTLLPFVLDEARHHYPDGFRGDRSVWRLLRDDPDAYIYPAIQHTARDSDGQPLPLPDEIAAGLDDVAQRGVWNTLTPPEWGLPTEIWRETVARRQRYEALRVKLSAGEVQRTADLVSLNLDIERFTRDAIETCEDPKLLRAFWKALRSVKVLDPTCGSGAFLFAALERLEALYTACLLRMQDLIGRLDPNASSQALSDFRDELREACDPSKHPNLTYFVLKRILLDNLYGVDIMPEAVEVCKLRLFLKLAAQVQPGGRLEPLPDIDFNVRAGNALVGYATREEVLRGLKGQRVAGGADQGRLLFDEDRDTLHAFEEKLDDVKRLADRFREQQQTHGGEVTPEDKEELRSRLRALADELDRALALEYGVAPAKANAFDAWCASHQPFHWFAEFYGVMSEGGFDVIVGNPPYVRHTSSSLNYDVVGYESRACRELYAYTMERTYSLGGKTGWSGLIVPMSFAASGAFDSIRAVVKDNSNLLLTSHFANRPGQLFEGA